MRSLHVLAAIFTLSACVPSEAETSFENGQSQLHFGSVVVPPGPVAIPVLPNIYSPLQASQVLCDSYQLDSGYDDAQDDDQGDEGPDAAPGVAAQCARTANRFYKELQVQLVFLKSSSTLDRGLAAIDAKTTYLFPDGSYTQGADAFKQEHPNLFGGSSVADIQNKFIYKPLNKDTVILIGDPTYTLSGGATVDSVQYHVYTRQRGGQGTCRSLFNLLGKVCWSEVAGEWAYKQPFSGTSSPHPTSSTRSQIPAATTYPVALEPERIVCDGAFRSRGGDLLNCEQTAREFYKEIQFQTLALTNPDTVTSGLAALNEATTFVYPTGLVTEGVSALATYTSSLFGQNSFPVAIENKYLYKAIDSDTVLFIGDPTGTMLNFVTGQTRPLESVQISVYRRNSTPLGNCRSATNLTGDVCWTELAEQWVYGQPMLGR